MVQQYRNKLEQLKGQKIQLENQIKTNKNNIKIYKKEKENAEKAQKILQIVAKETQNQIIFHISNTVTLALNSIFDEEYEFKLDFVEKRGKTEADIYLLKDGNKTYPLTDNGYGVVDIISISLRMALWCLSNKTNTIIMDEPAKFVSRNYIDKVAEMLKTLSKKLKVQLIIVTHIPELKEKADKVFEVKIKKGVSKIV